MVCDMGYSAVITEHLREDLPVSGADSRSESPSGWFRDTQSVLVGKSVQRVYQTFSASIDGVDAGLAIQNAFGTEYRWDS